MRDRDVLMNTLEHSWGTKPEQKAAEKRYNAEYYKKHRLELMEKRRKNSMDAKGYELFKSGGIKNKAHAQQAINEAMKEAYRQDAMYDKLRDEAVSDAIAEGTVAAGEKFVELLVDDLRNIR